MKLKPIITLALCWIIAPGVYGADLVEVSKLARDYDSTLSSARLAAEASGMQREIALSQVLPSVELGANYLDRRTNNKVDSTSGYITLNIPLYTYALRPGLDISDSEGALGDLRYQKAQQALLRRVVNAYFEILGAQDDLETTRAQVAAIEEFLKVTQQRSAVGLGTETDVHNALARQALANANEIRDVSAIETAWISLITITGYRPIEIDRLKEGVSMPLLQPDKVEHWVQLAFENNLDLTIQREVVNKARIMIRAAGAETGPNMGMQLTRREYGDKPGNNPEQQSIALSVTKSFSLGGHGRKLKQQASLLHKSEVQNLQALSEQVKSSVSRTFFSLESLYNQINALVAAKTASETALNAIEQGYQVGTLSSVDVLNAQSDLFEVTRDLHRARYEYLKNSILLQELAGSLTDESLETLNGFLE